MKDVITVDHGHSIISNVFIGVFNEKSAKKGL